ncbi:MAG: hypothetical protein ACXVA9_09510, partial [Bdellovibrionales bacterium]
YRKLDDLRAEVMQHCPVDHVLREVLPMTLPDRPYRAIYYGQMAMVVIVWFAFIFGLFWILKPSST